MNGFIGWADILGYKSFLLNTTSQAAVESVLEVVDAAGRETAEEINKMSVDEDDFVVNAIHASAEWFSFSDTIVLFVPVTTLPEKYAHMDVEMPFYCANYAAVAMDILQVRMFQKGLPIRGALHFGEYFRRGVSFGGKGIVSAYIFAEALNMAGVVATGTVAARLRFDSTGHAGPAVDLVVQYSAPFKSKAGEERKLVYLLTSDDEDTLASRNLEQEIQTAFTAHGKTIGEGVDLKVKNSLEFLNGVKTGNIKPVIPAAIPDLFHYEYEE